MRTRTRTRICFVPPDWLIPVMLTAVCLCIMSRGVLAQTFDTPPLPPQADTVYPGGNVVPAYPLYPTYPGYPAYPTYPAYPAYPVVPNHPPRPAPPAQGYPYDRNLNLDNRTPTLRDTAPRIGTPMPSRNVAPDTTGRYRRAP